MNSSSYLAGAAFPERLGTYRIIKRLGQGGQGAVFLAEDLKLRRQVALKILPPAFVASADACLRLEREAETTARVNHPAIAKIHEIADEGSYLFLAMEFIEGRTLSSILAETRLQGHSNCRLDSSTDKDVASSDPQKSTADRGSLANLIRCFETICRGLHAAHEKGLIHRDLKPANIMIQPDGQPVIIDFGLAHDQESEGVTLTETGQLLGTPAYMPPEQIEAKRGQIDARSDIYSLGATLYECCTLNRPFEAPTRHELLRAITKDAPLRPRSFNGRLPHDLEAIILTAMDREPKRRYQTAAAMADDLGRLLRHQPVLARRIGPTLRSIRWIRRNSLVSLMIFVVIVALASIAFISWTKSQVAERALAAEKLEREQKEALLVGYERLADISRLENAINAADKLLPPRPEIVGDLKDWQDRYGVLVARLPTHRQSLDDLNRRGQRLPRRPEDALSESAASSTDPDWLHFDNESDQFLHAVLSPFVSRLDEFVHGEGGAWQSVQERIKASEIIAQKTIDEARYRWEECRERIRANEAYADQDLSPQLGLIPLGPDPDSGLEEFLHWMTHEGDIPIRSADTGLIEVTENLGIILVLIPRGDFLMGSQSDDPKAANFVPRAPREEHPVHLIRLGSYFISKYEMTQGQWLRICHKNPSCFQPQNEPDSRHEVPTLCHPVERISWDDCEANLRLVDLTLPTETEWERAARGGRSDQIFSGTSSLSDLNRYANIAGSETKNLGFSSQQPGYEDDFIIHAAVGGRLPNDFGLHDMSGNVWEWCLDHANVNYNVQFGARGLRRTANPAENHIVRGGTFSLRASMARVAFRYQYAPSERGNALGVRPAMLIKD